MVGIQLIAKVGEKGQVVIPKPIRDKLHINKDSEVVFEMVNEQILIQRKKDGEQILKEFTSLLKNKIKLPKHIDWDKEYYSQFN